MLKLIQCSGVVAIALGLQACGPRPDAVSAVETALDSFHQAAAAADMEGYVGRMADNGVFLGTDATERWTRDQFEAFCEPYFARGRGWAYVPQQRHVTISTDGGTAWFDEILANESYGLVRGTGVLSRRGGLWKIEQYNLTFLVPNDIAKEVVKLIRGDDEDGESAP